MYPIPAAEYRARLKRWHTAPDRHSHKTLLDGKLITEHWSLGVCRLRMVRYKDGVELFGDRGVRGYPPARDKGGKIAFQYFGDAGL